MKTKFHYESAAIALDELKRQGFIIDFNKEQNRFLGSNGKYNIDNFKITDIYRYEGESDPADEVIIYAIESSTGEKGVLVEAYGMANDGTDSIIIARLKKGI